MPILVFARLAIWPFSSVPKCGNNSECLLLDNPTEFIHAGVQKPVFAVYRNGKRVPFTISNEKTLGPYAVTVPLKKTDSSQELIVFVYQKGK